MRLVTVPQFTISADVQLCLEASWHVLKLNCANEFGRHCHIKKGPCVYSYTATRLLNPSGARSQSKPVTMLAIKPCS